MRTDLAKCTTERERRGSGSMQAYKLKFGGKIRIHPEPDHEYPTEHGGFHSSAPNRHYESKDFTDVLGALRGNIRKAVGRKWDDVYSEFSRLLDRRSLSGYHIWTHLMREVTIDTYMEDGVVYEQPRRWYRYPVGVDGFYVHPITGILEYKERWSWRKWQRNQPKLPAEISVPGMDGWKYKQFDGLWFRYRSISQPIRNAMGSVINVLTIEKRSCNRKEIVWIKQQLRP